MVFYQLVINVLQYKKYRGWVFVSTFSVSLPWTVIFSCSVSLFPLLLDNCKSEQEWRKFESLSLRHQVINAAFKSVTSDMVIITQFHQGSQFFGGIWHQGCSGIRTIEVTVVPLHAFSHHVKVNRKSMCCLIDISLHFYWFLVYDSGCCPF